MRGTRLNSWDRAADECGGDSVAVFVGPVIGKLEGVLDGLIIDDAFLQEPVRGLGAALGDSVV